MCNSDSITHSISHPIWPLKRSLSFPYFFSPITIVISLGCQLTSRMDVVSSGSGQLALKTVGSKSHCRAVPSEPSPIWGPSNLVFIISSKLTYEVKNCNDIMFLC